MLFLIKIKAIGTNTGELLQLLFEAYKDKDRMSPGVGIHPYYGGVRLFVRITVKLLKNA